MKFSLDCSLRLKLLGVRVETCLVHEVAEGM